MLQQELEIRKENLLTEIYENFLMDGRVSYLNYNLGLDGHDMEKMMELLGKEPIIENIEKNGQSYIAFNVNEEALKEKFENCGL